jgi:hypothetical protein
MVFLTPALYGEPARLSILVRLTRKLAVVQYFWYVSEKWLINHEKKGLGFYLSFGIAFA